MTVVMASDLDADRELIDQALSDPDCPVDEVLRTGTTAGDLQGLDKTDASLVLFGFPCAAGDEMPWQTISSLPASTAVLFIMDASGASRLGSPLPVQVEGIVVREAISAGELASSIASALEDASRHGSPGARRTTDADPDRTHLRTVFEKSPAIVATFRGPDHVCTMANPQYRQLVGDRDVVGDPVRKIVPEVEGQGYFELMDEVYQEGRPTEGTERSLDIRTEPEGRVERRYVDFLYQPLRENGDVVGVIAHGVDVTATVRSRKQVEETERELRDVLRTIADGVLLTDEGGTIVYVNPAAERILGADADTLRGLDCHASRWDVRTPSGRPVPAEERPIPRVLREEEPMDSATYRLGREEDEVIVSINAAAMTDGDDETVGVVASLRDVTERERIRADLRETSRLLDAVVESIPDAIYAKDRDGRYLMINSTGAELFGRSVSDVIGRTDRALFTVEDASKIREDDLHVMNTGRPRQFREQARMHDGERRHFDVTKAPLRSGDGDVGGIVGITRDISERMQVEEQRRVTREKFEKLFRASPLGIAVSTVEDGRILEVNEGFESLLGHEREELIGSRATDLDIWVDEAAREDFVGRLHSTGEVRAHDARFRRSDGEKIEVELSAEQIELDGTPSVITVIRDVTEQRQRRRELASSREKLQQYASHVTSARERERKQLARDIHDQLGQLLTAIKLKVKRLRTSAVEGESVDPDVVDSALDLVDQGVEEIRELSTTLRPSALDQFGLVDAVRWQAERAEERFGLETAVESAVDELQLDEERETHVFRVVQEALTNVGRHADADRAVVELSRTEGRLQVRVLDDGIGVDRPAVAQEDTFGLLGMEERAHVLGGEFQLTNRPEGGTEVRLDLPVRRGHGS